MRVGVVGGGLAGLVAAYELARRGCTVALFECSDRLGGQVYTQYDRGFVIDHGAEGYAAGTGMLQNLLWDLDLTDRSVKQLTRRVYALQRGKLQPLPQGKAGLLMGIQASSRGGLVSLRNGMGELVARLVDRLKDRVEIHTGVAARAIRPAAGEHGLSLLLADGSAISVDRAVVAIPPAALAPLLPDPLQRALDELASLPTISSVSVSLAYRRTAVGHPLDAAGLVALDGLRDRPGFKACAFSSSKFPGRAPEGWVLLRAFFRPGTGYPLDAPDQWWVARAEKALAACLQLRTRAAFSWVARWESALPLWDDRRLRAVGRVRRALRAYGPVELAGSAYHKSGLPGAVRSAVLATRRLLS